MLLQLAMFASSAHASEHPYHAHDELCTSFIGFGQQDLTVDIPATVFEYQGFFIAVFTTVKPYAHSFSNTAYSPRAPPIS